MQSTEEQAYQQFKVKFIKSITALKDDVEKLSETNKQRFKNEIKSLLVAEIPNMIEFLKN